MTTKTRSAAEQRRYDDGFAEGLKEGLAEGKEAGREEFRQRVEAICKSDEAKGRFDSAIKIALNSDLTVEHARELLATLPEGPIKSNGMSEFAKAMMHGNPEIDVGCLEDEESPHDGVRELKAAYRESGGELKDD